MNREVLFPKLKSIMALNGENQTDLAKLLNLSAPTITKKLDGTIKFSPAEKQTISEHYKRSQQWFGF